MNLHTHMVQTLKKTSKVDHHSTIVQKVDGILTTIEDLMEDPLFIDAVSYTHLRAHETPEQLGIPLMH